MRLSLLVLPILASCHEEPARAPAREPAVATRPRVASLAPPALPPAATSRGIYARDAISIWEAVGGNAETHSWTSPDRRSTVRARWIEGPKEKDEEAVVIDISGAIGTHRMRLMPGVATEFFWSPESDALAFYTSESGLNGHFSLILVGRYGRRLSERDVSELVIRRFGQPVRCDWPEAPNVGAIAWLPNGHIVASAEIVHHSVCDSYGTFKAYEIDPKRMRIVREFSQREAKKRFGPKLGFQLADAEDICEERPERCTVAYRRDHPHAGR